LVGYPVMQPIVGPPSDTKVALLGLCTAALMAAGTFFQKLNGVRGGNVFVSGWLALSVICFLPTFPIANKVFLMGGRMSLFVPATAATYVFSMLVGRFYFGEEVSLNRWLGCALIMLGVGAIARG
jgi:drug/metabolite transporter (DMT)-like permease